MSWNYKPLTATIFVIDLDKKTNQFAPRKKFRVDIEKYNKRHPNDQVKIYEEYDHCKEDCDKLNLN